jgi:ABC transporter substrate binding protein
MRLIGLAVILGLGLTLAPLGAEAQQAGKVHRIGVLHPGTSQTASTEAFRRGLRDLGYVEGQTVVIQWRWAAGKPELYRDLAIDLVRSGVDVIVAAHSQSALPAKHVSPTTPIVVAGAGDAVRDGLVESLARPGGNVTGLSLMIPELTPKRLQLLKEVIPTLSRLALLRSPIRMVVSVGPKVPTAGIPLTVRVGVLDGKNAVSGFRTTALVAAPSLGLKALQEKLKSQLADTRPGPVPGGDDMPMDIRKLLALRNRLLARTGKDVFATVSGPLTFTAGAVSSGQFAATQQQGSYNLAVVATGNAPVSGGRFVRKDQVSVLVR